MTRVKLVIAMLLNLTLFDKKAVQVKGSFFIVLLIFGIMSVSATSIDFMGTIDNDTIWGSDTIRIIGEVTVQNGSTLEIFPSTVILIDGVYSFNVQGRILAVGNVQDSIVFSTEYSSDLWGGFDYLKTPLTNDTSFYSFCRIDHAELDGIGVEGGAFCCDSFSKVRIENCLIANNGDGGINAYGGAVYCRYSDIVIVNCIIKNNNADGSICGGGGVYLDHSNPFIINTLFLGNSSYGSISHGGALYCIESSPEIIHCTFIRNRSDGAGGSGAGIYCSNGSCPQIWGSIFWANDETQVSIADSSSRPDFYYCDIQGGVDDFYGAYRYFGNFNKSISDDPYFNNDNDFDYTLSDSSPCINTGPEDISSLSLPSKDLLGNPRIYQGMVKRIDMGVYEFQGEPNSSHVLFFNSAKTADRNPVTISFDHVHGFSVRIGYHDNAEIYLEIIDMAGKSLWQKTVHNSTVIIPELTLHGVYFLLWRSSASEERGIVRFFSL